MRVKHAMLLQTQTIVLNGAAEHDVERSWGRREKNQDQPNNVIIQTQTSHLCPHLV